MVKAELTEATPSDSPPPPPPPPQLWEVRPSPGKGRGVFARQHIAAGTRIHAEDPLFSIQPPTFHPGRGFLASEVAAAVDAAVANLSEAEQAGFYACHEHRLPHEVDDDNDRKNRNLAILRSNAYMLPDGRSALFPRLARVNHSCRPNAAHLWDPNPTAGRGGKEDGDRVFWVAARDIEAGEEITVTYVDVLTTAAERRGRLAQYGFACDCEACTQQARQHGEASESDARGVRMGALLRTLRDNHDNEQEGGGIAALGKDLQLMRWAEELVQMLEEDGLMDYLPQAYGYAARLSFRLGDERGAADWRRKGIELLSI